MSRAHIEVQGRNAHGALWEAGWRRTAGNGAGRTARQAWELGRILTWCPEHVADRDGRRRG